MDKALWAIVRQAFNRVKINDADQRMLRFGETHQLVILAYRIDSEGLYAFHDPENTYRLTQCLFNRSVLPAAFLT